MSQPVLLWEPPESLAENSNSVSFTRHCNHQLGLSLQGYHDLYEWSVANPALFWQLFWRFGDVVATGSDEVTLQGGDRFDTAKWFPDVRLNYAENLLKRCDDHPALVFRGEDKVRSSMSYRELYLSVARTAMALRESGVQTGDRVIGFMPNMPETIVAMLAAASIGAIWSSSSPDFGVKGVLDRFGQIEPVVLFAVDAYHYNGKTHDAASTVREFASQLPSLKKIVLIPYVHTEMKLPDDMPGAELYADFTDNNASDIQFERLPFDHALYIMFSSGTTGVPKCIVHGAGGTLLKHLAEHRLQADLRPDDRFFYFTTCGWMMWNWMVSGLATGVTLMLYDGSPFYPDGNVLFDFASEESISIFGTSAKFLDAASKSGVKPAQTHNLNAVRAILSTGSPLSPESYDYVYRDICNDVCLSSVSGGTDIMGCFLSGSVELPVYRGEIQCRSLGMDVRVFNEDGNSIVGEKGELVCTAPFPSTPIAFWNDEDGSKYHDAYFARFENVWCHGDYMELTPRKSLIIYGRSDAVLNPGGVRIGTAEIYRQVEQLDEILESLVVGQDWESDVRVVLFVCLRDGVELSADLIDKIKLKVRTNATPRHVPAVIIQVADIPRTKSGKIVELAVRNIIHGREVKNRDALANPQALELFAGLAELQTSP